MRAHSFGYSMMTLVNDQFDQHAIPDPEYMQLNHFRTTSFKQLRFPGYAFGTFGKYNKLTMSHNSSVGDHKGIGEHSFGAFLD